MIALREVNATLRGVPAGLPFRLDARILANGDTFTFETDEGPLVILAIPSGTTGIDQLEPNAMTFEVAGLRVRAASIEDLILMKRASGRPKDRIELEVLNALLEERATGEEVT